MSLLLSLSKFKNTFSRILFSAACGDFCEFSFQFKISESPDISISDSIHHIKHRSIAIWTFDDSWSLCIILPKAKTHLKKLLIDLNVS
jgi:hypothetical protein